MDRFLLRAGFVPLPWFLLWVSLAGFLAADYSAISQHASELSRHSLVVRSLFQVGVIGVGVAYSLLSVGLWRKTGRRVSFGALALLLYGLSMISNGIWPMGDPKHGLYSIGIFSLVAPPLSLLELASLRSDSTAYRVTVLVTVAGIFYLWLILMGHDPPQARGLTQRVFSSINSLWPAVMAWLLLRK